MRSARRFSLGFTLIELLVVIAILSLLMSILMPTLRDARTIALRATCAADQRTCALACVVYAEDNNDHLPPSPMGNCVNSAIYMIHNWSSGCLVWPDPTEPRETFHHWDMRWFIGPYIGDFAAWGCPAVGAPSIDDAANVAPTEGESGSMDYTFTELFCNFLYFPGNTRAQFGWGDAYYRTPFPFQTARAQNTSALPMLQDLFWDDEASSILRFTHGRGTRTCPYPNDSRPGVLNPSYTYLTSFASADPDGANITYYDGHVEWKYPDEMWNFMLWRDWPPGTQIYVRSTIPEDVQLHY